MIRLFVGAVLLSGSAVAMAADPVAFRAIAANDLATATTQLESQIAAGSNEPGVLLNLAHVYRQAGRGAAAETLYRQVLSTPNVLLAKADGNPAWSHRLAQRGLEKNAQFAAR